MYNIRLKAVNNGQIIKNEGLIVRYMGVYLVLKSYKHVFMYCKNSWTIPDIYEIICQNNL